MPLASMLKETLKQVMKRIASKKKQWGAPLEQLIAPMILQKLEKRIENLRLREASWIGGGYCSVTHGTDAFMVRLTERTCSCKS